MKIDLIHDKLKRCIMETGWNFVPEKILTSCGEAFLTSQKGEWCIKETGELSHVKHLTNVQASNELMASLFAEKADYLYPKVEIVRCDMPDGSTDLACLSTVLGYPQMTLQTVIEASPSNRAIENIIKKFSRSFSLVEFIGNEDFLPKNVVISSKDRKLTENNGEVVVLDSALLNYGAGPDLRSHWEETYFEIDESAYQNGLKKLKKISPSFIRKTVQECYLLCSVEETTIPGFCEIPPAETVISLLQNGREKLIEQNMSSTHSSTEGKRSEYGIEREGLSKDFTIGRHWTHLAQLCT